MEVGQVFKWNVKFGKHNPKERYWVYLGKTPIFDRPICVYICDSTTQLCHYETGGSRLNHQFIKIDALQYGFPHTSILDLENIETIESHKILEKDLEFLGQIPKEVIKVIYNKLIKSKNISRKIKLEIRDNLSRFGIDSLPKP